MNLVVVVTFLLNGDVGQMDVGILYVANVRRVPAQASTLHSCVVHINANELDAAESTEARVEIIHAQGPEASDEHVSLGGRERTHAMAVGARCSSHEAASHLTGADQIFCRR